jgi:uncharacterized protein YndB with AHSA1/START domain
VSVTSVQKDTEKLTMTVTAEYDVSIDRAWELWSDPRQLERWWGPPIYPATMVDHDLTPGGAVSYYMTSPEGEKYHGWWRVLEVEAPRLLVVEDGFADDLGQPQAGMPVTHMRVVLAERSAGGVSMSIESTFASLEAMEQLITMGMEEGLQLAIGQIDAILAS